MIRRHMERGIEALPIERLADPKVQKALMAGGSFVAWQLAKRHPIGRAAIIARHGAKLVGTVRKARTAQRTP